MSERETVSLVARAATVIAAEIAFVGLVAKLLIDTWQAKTGVPPDPPAVQVSAVGGLALVLGGGYALILGVPAQLDPATGLWAQLKRVDGVKVALLGGALIYMVAGFAICITYALRSSETPEVLKTVAIAFSGYVIAYIGTAYQQLS
jgi:hypothetical protein